MNENLNLVEILNDCPKGTLLYSTIHDNVRLKSVIFNDEYLIVVEKFYDGESLSIIYFTNEGKLYKNFKDSETTLFPSKENRDWSTFKVKKPKFDPKTLQPFDNVSIVLGDTWKCAIFSHLREIRNNIYKCECIGSSYPYYIQYNEDTKHLIGIKDEAPEYYRYWED